LKPGGKGVLHIVIDDEDWKPEQEWRGDKSVLGRIKLKYGLNCFGRTREKVEERLTEEGFVEIRCLELSEICDFDDDIVSQNLFVFKRPSTS